MILNWLNKLFKYNNPKEWLKPLYDNIEFVWLANKSIKFKIVEIKKKGFLVKTGGLFAYLPLQLMPWEYKHLSFWDAVGKSLAGKVFYGKITELKEKEDKKYNIIVDATIHKFKEVALHENEQYTGIVLYAYEYGLLIDIGCDFNWKYGSIIGYVSILNFMDYDSFQSYESGAYINVVFERKGKRGLIFAEAEYFDLYSKYVGKTAWGKIIKNENSSIKILIEDKYKATPRSKKLEILLAKNCDDGDIIDCELINFDSKRGFVIKWIVNDEIEWDSEEIKQYIGKIVDVNVQLKGDDIQLLVENKYPGILFKKYHNKYNMKENAIIQCKVKSINLNPNKRYFDLRPVKLRSKSANSILDKIDAAIAEKLRNI